VPPSITLALGLIVIATAVLAIARRVDVRLVMFLAALAMGSVAGNPLAILRTFFATLSSEKFIVPICSAMGFAYVLRHTGCDQHLVQMLVKPLRRVRPLLIPGAVCVGFVVNASVISQASTAVAVGTVLVPLLQAARLTPTTVGATLLLGSSLGGELLNPGAPEVGTVAGTLGVEPRDSVQALAPLLFVQLGVATVLFWLACLRAEARVKSDAPEVDPTEGPVADDPTFRVNVFKAVVPLVPLALLMVVGPPFNLLHVPKGWLTDGAGSGAEGVRLIGALMLLGAALAVLAEPKAAGVSAKLFFEGAGYAFTNIVAVIVTAQCFGKGVELIGLSEQIGALVAGSRSWLWPCAAALALAFAALCGSGMAATTSLFPFFAVEGIGTGVLLRVGAVVSIAAAAGRTMSPVAAVVLMCAALTGSQPLAIARRVALPLLAATVATAAVAAGITR
jgi:DcuC family C4-dicarboxylate transporter